MNVAVVAAGVLLGGTGLAAIAYGLAAWGRFERETRAAELQLELLKQETRRP